MVEAEKDRRRVIAHVDADAFYASVHLLEDPSLKGKPVVVAGSGQRSIVTTANYEARKYGIGSAQPAARARQLCPHAVFLRPDFTLYRAYSSRAMEIVRSYTPLVEPLSLDEAYLDITSLEKPIRAMREMVAEIRERTGLSYSVGIGPNKLCAKMLSDWRKPQAFNVASREQCCEIFAEQAPRLIPGIGPKTAQSLDTLGLRTIGSIGSAPPDVLERAFGQRRAEELRQRARFEHTGEVEASRSPKSKSEETTFEHDVTDIAELEGVLHRMSGELAELLEKRDMRARTIGIKVRLSDFTTVTRARTISHFTNERGDIAAHAIDLLREYSPPQPVRLIGVRVASFEHEVEEPADPEHEQLRLPWDWDEFAAAPERFLYA
jgi:DNA polymerase IV